MMKTKKSGPKPKPSSGPESSGVGLALYKSGYDGSPCLVVLGSPNYAHLVAGTDSINGLKHFIRPVDPNEVAAKRKSTIQEAVAKAIIHGWIAREDGEDFLDRLFAASCLRETWRKENGS